MSTSKRLDDETLEYVVRALGGLDALREELLALQAGELEFGVEDAEDVLRISDALRDVYEGMQEALWDGPRVRVDLAELESTISTIPTVRNVQGGGR